MVDCSIVVYDDRKDIDPILSTSMIVKDYANALDVHDGTRDSYLSSIKYFLNWLQLNHIEAVNRQVMLDYKRYLIATYPSASTVNAYLAGVRSLFKYLETLGIPNVMSTIRSVKQSKTHKKLPLTKEQALTIQSNIGRGTLQEKRDYAIYELCLRNGLREIELARANVEDISMRDGEHILYLQGKFQNEKNTFVVLCPTVMEALNDYLMARGSYKMSDPLFIGLAHNKFGTRLTTRSIRRQINKMLIGNNCKNKRVTPHSLRHTAITSLTKASDNDLLQAQIFARHSDVNTTTIYIHEDQRISNAPEKILEAYLNGSIDEN